MMNLKDAKLDDAFRTLITLLNELEESHLAHLISEIYEELLTIPSQKRTILLRRSLRSKLASRPGGIEEMYFEKDGTKNKSLLHATEVIHSFARIKFLDIFYVGALRKKGS